MINSYDLSRLTRHVNARIDELFTSPQNRNIPQIAPGVVRIVLDEAQAFGYWPLPNIPSDWLPHAQPGPVSSAADSDAVSTTDGIAHSQELRPARKTAFLGVRVDDDQFATILQAAEQAGQPGNISAGVRAVIDAAPVVEAAPATTGDDPLQALHTAVIAEIRRIATATGAAWVTQAAYNAAAPERSERLPSGSNISARLEKPWADLVREALGPDAAPPKPAGRPAKPSADPQPEAQPAETPEPEPDPEPARLNFRRRLDRDVPRLLGTAPTPPAEPTGESAAVVPTAADRRRQMMRDICATLVEMADDGIMPSEATWNEKRPDRLPDALGIRLSWDITWAELAAWAKLPMPGPKARHKAALQANGG